MSPVGVRHVLGLRGGRRILEEALGGDAAALEEDLDANSARPSQCQSNTPSRSAGWINPGRALTGEPHVIVSSVASSFPFVNPPPRKDPRRAPLPIRIDDPCPGIRDPNQTESAIHFLRNARSICSGLRRFLEGKRCVPLRRCKSAPSRGCQPSVPPTSRPPCYPPAHGNGAVGSDPPKPGSPPPLTFSTARCGGLTGVDPKE